jgi:hypothetical protein
MARVSDYVDVEIDVDIEEYIDEVSTEALLEELRKRKNVSFNMNEQKDLLEEALADIRGGRLQDAAVVLERLLYPKFKRLDDCIHAISKMKGVENV